MMFERKTAFVSKINKAIREPSWPRPPGQAPGTEVNEIGPWFSAELKAVSQYADVKSCIVGNERSISHESHYLGQHIAEGRRIFSHCRLDSMNADVETFVFIVRRSEQPPLNVTDTARRDCRETNGTSTRSRTGRGFEVNGDEIPSTKGSTCLKVDHRVSWRNIGR
jgi:hypothetical protein